MTIDLKTVKHISKLARISLEEKKAEKLADDAEHPFCSISTEYWPVWEIFNVAANLSNWLPAKENCSRRTITKSFSLVKVNI